MSFTLRKATLDDRPAIERLIKLSARGLSRAQYSDEQIEGAIRTVFGVDTSLIEGGTYFLAESGGELIGCGGWSRRRTLFGGDSYERGDGGGVEPNSHPV